MNVTMTTQDSTLNVLVEGRLDTNTAPDLAAKLEEVPAEITRLVIDCTELQYISSAGLRVLLQTHKNMMKKGGELIVSKPNDLLMEVFDVTGFVDILTIEQ